MFPIHGRTSSACLVSLPMRRRSWTIAMAAFFVGVALTPESSSAENEREIDESRPIEEIVVIGRRPVTATSTRTIPAESFDLRPLESGGQMLEVVPNLVTARFVSSISSSGKLSRNIVWSLWEKPERWSCQPTAADAPRTKTRYVCSDFFCGCTPASRGGPDRAGTTSLGTWG